MHVHSRTSPELFFILQDGHGHTLCLILRMGHLTFKQVLDSIVQVGFLLFVQLKWWSNAFLCDIHCGVNRLLDRAESS